MASVEDVDRYVKKQKQAKQLAMITTEHLIYSHPIPIVKLSLLFCIIEGGFDVNVRDI